MSTKIFFDTNIVLDFLDSKRPHHQNAKTLFAKTIVNEYQVVISEDMLSTIYYIHKDKKTALAFFETILKDWEVVPYGRSLISEVISYCQQTGYDFEDTLQCFCAKKHNCLYIITSDKKFVDCGVRVVQYDTI